MNELHQKMLELRKKGKKAKSEGKRGESKSEEVGEVKGSLNSMGHGSMVMMARREGTICGL